jgi:hypothetical protein
MELFSVDAIPGFRSQCSCRFQRSLRGRDLCSPQHGIGRCGSQCQQRNPLRGEGCIAPGGFAAARPGKGQRRLATDLFGFTSMLKRLPLVRRPTIGKMRHPPTYGA